MLERALREETYEVYSEEGGEWEERVGLAKEISSPPPPPFPHHSNEMGKYEQNYENDNYI